ncbi:hypothetical protein BGW38_009708 [Lunasporangiospora selenospora]|uniref:Uncharacterized protein n=1 Tax=Lunasporangiospora selenospora TaxID=979761 RepID=A0A9P6G3C9_9FUNG|nr:hypothetical protein BGW38_009708 [Lunasporangiospora selenospora]
MRFLLSSSLSTRTNGRSQSSILVRKSMAWSILSSFVVLSTLFSSQSSLLSGSSSLVAAAPPSGFCGDCQTYALAIAPCGGTFTAADIAINGAYTPAQQYSKCLCTSVMQGVLWKCGGCQKNDGFKIDVPPPQKHQTMCLDWGVSIQDYNAPYTGPVAPGTAADLGNGGKNPVTTGQPGNNNNNNNPNTSTNGGPSSTSNTTQPSSSNDKSVTEDKSSGSGPSGAAIGISLGIIGVAVIAGLISVFMMRRRRARRHAPLDLDGTYLNVDNSWEKPRPGSPSLNASPMVNAPAPATRGPMMGNHNASPFDRRPPGGGGGSVVGGYDPQYDQYDQYNNGGGYGGGGYDQYHHHGGMPQQNYPAHDYGYDHTVPTSGPYHSSKHSEAGHYM